jgi:DNA-binding MarR family transcriptional regulator
MNTLPSLRILSPLHKANRQIQLFMEARYRELGVSIVEARLLEHCLQFSPCWISELHRVLGEKSSTLTSILDRLEQAGLLSRKLNRQDRRSRLVFLSPEGKRLALKLRGFHEEFEATLLQHLQESDLVKFERVIEAILEVTNTEVHNPKQSQTSVKPGRRLRAG